MTIDLAFDPMQPRDAGGRWTHGGPKLKSTFGYRGGVGSQAHARAIHQLGDSYAPTGELKNEVESGPNSILAHSLHHTAEAVIRRDMNGANAHLDSAAWAARRIGPGAMADVQAVRDSLASVPRGTRSMRSEPRELKARPYPLFRPASLPPGFVHNIVTKAGSSMVLTNRGPAIELAARTINLQPHRQVLARSMRKLADESQKLHPEMDTHQHLRDAARALDRRNNDGAKRHLDAAMQTLAPQSLYRHGILDDDGHADAKRSMNRVNRHLLMVKDLDDAEQENNRRVDEYRARQTAGNPDMNAPAHIGSGGPQTGRPMHAPNDTTRRETSIDTPALRARPFKTAAVGGATGTGGSYSSWDDVDNAIEMAWIDHPSKDEWAAIDARTGHSFHDSGSGSDEDKADRHIEHAKSAAGIGQHSAAMAHMARASSLTQDAGKQARINDLAKKMARTAQLQGKGSQWNLSVEMSAQTPALAVTPHPFGKPGGPGLWHVKNMELPPYIQNIAHALLRTGRAKTLSQAIAIARGATKRWKEGGGHVHPEVRAAAAGADAEWRASQARAHAHSIREEAWRLIDLAIEMTGTAAGAAKDSRVPAGQPGGGTFGKGSGQAAPAKGGKKTAPGKKGPPGKKQPSKTHSQSNAAQRAQAKRALLAKAHADRVKARQLTVQLNALLNASKRSTASNRAATRAGATGKSAAATPAATGAGATSAAQAAGATTGASATGASSRTSRAASSAAARQGQINALRGQIAALYSQANKLTAQAAKL